MNPVEMKKTTAEVMKHQEKRLRAACVSTGIAERQLGIFLGTDRGIIVVFLI
jgi:hypothetical protein